MVQKYIMSSNSSNIFQSVKELRRRRTKLGVSQLLLSAKAKVSCFKLNLAERGLIQLRADELRRLARTLKFLAVKKTRA